MSGVTEAVVETAALAWLESLGWTIAPGAATEERAGQCWRLLNPRIADVILNEDAPDEDE